MDFFSNDLYEVCSETFKKLWENTRKKRKKDLQGEKDYQYHIRKLSYISRE